MKCWIEATVEVQGTSAHYGVSAEDEDGTVDAILQHVQVAVEEAFEKVCDKKEIFVRLQRNGQVPILSVHAEEVR